MVILMFVVRFLEGKRAALKLVGERGSAVLGG